MAKVTIEIHDGRDGKDAHVRLRDTDMENLVFACGALQQFAGLVALKNGVSLDDVRDHMLDVHLAAMGELADEAARRARASETGGWQWQKGRN